MRDYRNIFNKVVPYHTDDSMSLYEFVGRLYEYLKDFEGSLDEAHQKIDEFITQFSVDLNDTTKKILTEWHDDGTLEEIISLVWEEKADKTYVDSLVNQTADALTDSLTDVGEHLAQTTTDLKVYAALPPFNVKADGTDQHENLQNAINYGYDNGINQIVLPKGTITISRPLYVWGGDNYVNKATSLVGQSMNDTAIHKNTNRTTGDGSLFGDIDAIIIHAPRDLSDKPIYNIRIEEMRLYGTVDDETSTYVEYGIYSLYKSASIINRRLHISKINTGIHINAGTWQSTFKNIFMRPEINGFYIDDTLGSGSTSNSLDSVYVYGASGIAFRLRGTYTSVSNLAVDLCTGIAYDFYYANISASGLGVESDCDIAIRNRNSYINIDNLHIQGMQKPGTTVFETSSSADTNINIARIGHGENIIDGYLYKLGQINSNLTIKDLITKNKYLKQHTFTGSSYGSRVSITGTQNTAISMRGSRIHMPFIGHDRNRGNFLDMYNETPTLQGKAIYMDASGSPLTNGNGDDLEWQDAPGLGDLFIENNPEQYGVYGYVCTNVNGSYMGSCTFKPIAIVTGGTTANRPTAPKNYIQYFDTTLGFPIWWNGSNWVDATGTSV